MGGISVLALMGILSSLLIILIIIMIVVIIWLILSYIFESMAIYGMTKRLNYKYPILSFIPIYNKVYLGRIVNKEKIGKVLFIINLIELLFLCCFFTITNQDLSLIFFILSIITIITNLILKIYLTHSVIQKVTSKYAYLLTILNSLTLGITRPFMLFIVRKNNKII